MKKFSPSLFLVLLITSEISAQLNAVISSTNPTCMNNDGSAAVLASGSSVYTYKWSTGATTASVSNLAAGTYTVTVYSSAGTLWDTVYFEQFEAIHNWTLNTSTGANGADNNYWDVDDDESGVAPGGCGAANLNNKTLHITSVFNPSGGAAYDAGGLCGILYCPQTNMAATSPNINTTGVTNLVLTYDFIGNGQALSDNASSSYSNNGGGNYTSLDASLKSGVCGGGQGRWAQRSYNLPASCNNISNFQIRFNWTNNDDGTGTDPSVALNNILLRDSVPGTADSIVKTVTLTLPASPYFVTAALSMVNPTCGQSNGSINNVGVGGGTSPYTLIWKINGAQIGSSNSLINVGAGTYTFEATDQNGCTIDTSFTLVAGGGGSTTITTSQNTICASDSAVICAPSGAVSYLWNTGQTTACITTYLAGNYYVTVTLTGNCTAVSNHLTISVLPLPPVSITVNGDTLSAYNAVNYQWYLDGTAINGATDSVHIAAQSGNYSVAVTDSNGCVAFSTNVSVNVSGIDDETSETSILVLPNPFGNALHVSGHGFRFEIFDLSGRKIAESVAPVSISTSEWSKGTYFLKSSTYMRRIVKE